MTQRILYDKQFKESAVKLSYERSSVLQAAKELGISDSSLGKWRKDFEKYGDKSISLNQSNLYRSHRGCNLKSVLND